MRKALFILGGVAALWALVGLVAVLIYLGTLMNEKAFWVLWFSGIGGAMGWLCYDSPICGWMRRYGKERPDA